jgi:hypothetical protein
MMTSLPWLSLQSGSATTQRRRLPSTRGCTPCVDCPFEFDFRAQTFQIAVNDSHGQLPAVAAIGDSAIGPLQRSVDLNMIESFGVTDIREAEIVLLGPEERDGVKRLSLSKYVPRRGLTLTLGHDPVFHADSLAAQPIRPARDVARCEDTRDARREVLIYQEAAIDSESRSFGQRIAGRTPTPTTTKSASSLSPLVNMTLRSSIDVALAPRWKVAPCVS